MYSHPLKPLKPLKQPQNTEHMILENMTIPEIRKHLAMDTELLLRSMNHHKKRLQRKRIKHKVKTITEYYTISSRNKNKWLIILFVGKSIGMLRLM